MATTATAKRTSENGESTRNGNSHRQRPIWTKKGFPCQVAVFEFPTENGGPNYSVKLTRSFRRDKESEWETTDYLGGGDLLRAARLLEAADTFIQSRLEADFKARKASEDVTDGDIPF